MKKGLLIISILYKYSLNIASTFQEINTNQNKFVLSNNSNYYSCGIIIVIITVNNHSTWQTSQI